MVSRVVAHPNERPSKKERVYATTLKRLIEMMRNV